MGCLVEKMSGEMPGEMSLSFDRDRETLLRNVGDLIEIWLGTVYFARETVWEY